MYKYLGDKLTDAKFKGKDCEAVRREDGKCIRGKNGNMLVKFTTGQTVNVLARLLRKSFNHELPLKIKNLNHEQKFQHSS